MRRIQFVFVTDHEIVEDKLPDLRGRQVHEAQVLPPSRPNNGPRLEFDGGLCQLMLKAHTYYTDCRDDVAAIEGEPFRPGYLTLTQTSSEFLIIPIAVSDDDGISWRLFPLHPDYKPDDN